eukprot:2374435-Amphidinium_carterae.2
MRSKHWNRLRRGSSSNPLSKGQRSIKSQTKPPGFPPGTTIPKGFDVVDSGRILYQPALLPDHMLLAQSKAAKLAIQSLPKEAIA